MDKKLKVKRIVFILLMYINFVYLLYRAFYTLPFNSGLLCIIIAFIILFLETFDSIDFFLYYYKLLLNKIVYKPRRINKKDYPHIDVFIATINESIPLLEETIKACVNMDYPDKDKIHIYVSDDGRRKEVKNLSLKYGVNYITRRDNKNAKAGNYNNVLKHTNSPYIVTFDADMKPNKNFLLKVVPYIIGIDNVGFVQTPQFFDNPDIYQLRFRLLDNIPSEQDYFYEIIQPSRMITNTVVYCGTNAIISRKALEEVGGFASKTVTEDIATGMFIESLGYKGIALTDHLVLGKSVNDIDSFAKQRSRWGCGSLQIVKNYGVLRNKNLTLRQKIAYFNGILYWLFCYKRFLYLLIPLLYSLFGLNIVECDMRVFLTLFLLNYVLKRFVVDMLEEHKRSFTWYAIYEIVLAPIMIIQITKELFGFTILKFDVSSKDKIDKKMTPINRKLFSSHLMLLLIHILAVILSIYKGSLIGIHIYYFTLVWLLLDIVYLIIAIIFDLGYKNNDYNEFIPSKTDKYTFKSITDIFTNFIKSVVIK